MEIDFRAFAGDFFELERGDLEHCAAPSQSLAVMIGVCRYKNPSSWKY